MNTPACPLCCAPPETLLWRDDLLRVILVDDAFYGGFCRVILQRHVPEMTDLLPTERAQVMRAVYAVEQALRELLRPDKINLASLGNQVPHLHWHVIPRFKDDAHFPDPIWAAARRSTPARAVDAEALRSAIGKHLASP
jgi:diadenosine tetraphosphate (Ap4A) HIT family hydrolase